VPSQTNILTKLPTYYLQMPVIYICIYIKRKRDKTFNMINQGNNKSNSASVKQFPGDRTIKSFKICMSPDSSLRT